MANNYLTKFFGGMAIAVTLTACHGKQSASDTLPCVQTDIIQAATQQLGIQYPGRVKAAEDLNLAFKVSGTILRIVAPEGSHFRKGDLLAEMDPADYRAQLDATEAEYKQVKNEAERIMALYKEEVVSSNTNDKAVYGLRQMEAKLQHHRDQLEYTRLYAPFDGYMQKHLFNAHETLAAGMPVLSIISSGSPEVEMSLPAAEYIRRDSFRSFTCTFSLYPGVVYPLRLLSITPKANANQLYSVRLSMDVTGRPLPSPGMNAMVSIATDQDDQTSLLIEANALQHEGDQTYIYVYDEADSIVHRREVELLRLLSDGKCIIRSTQAHAGDVIVNYGARQLHDGQRVKLLPAQTPTNVGGLL